MKARASIGCPGSQHAGRQEQKTHPARFQGSGPFRAARMSILASWAVMRAASGYQDALNEGGAGRTGQAGAQVDTVLKLKESAHAVGVNVVGNRGAAQTDRMLQNLR